MKVQKYTEYMNKGAAEDRSGFWETLGGTVSPALQGQRMGELSAELKARGEDPGFFTEYPLLSKILMTGASGIGGAAIGAAGGAALGGKAAMAPGALIAGGSAAALAAILTPMVARQKAEGRLQDVAHKPINKGAVKGALKEENESSKFGNTLGAVVVPPKGAYTSGYAKTLLELLKGKKGSREITPGTWVNAAGTLSPYTGLVSTITGGIQEHKSRDEMENALEPKEASLLKEAWSPVDLLKQLAEKAPYLLLAPAGMGALAGFVASRTTSPSDTDVNKMQDDFLREKLRMHVAKRQREAELAKINSTGITEKPRDIML